MTINPNNRNTLPRWPWLAYAVLLAVGIPWYWPVDASHTVLGWPVWALVSLLASAGMSVLTAYLAIAYWHVAEGRDHVAEQEHRVAEGDDHGV